MHSLGPFFDVDRHEVGERPTAPWRSMAELFDADVLSDRVEQVRAALAHAGQRTIADVRPRIAASVMHLGLVARLISPVLAEAALTGRRVPVELADWWWQPQPAGSFPMSLPRARGDSDDDGAEHVDHGVMDGRAAMNGPVAALTASVSDRFGLSVRVVWGNVASALNATRGLIGAADPARSQRIESIAAVIRQHPGLAYENCPFGPAFQRRSCCLIYQLTPERLDAVCGDCVLRKPRGAEPG